MSLRLGTSLALLILAGMPAAAQVTITNSSPLPYGSLNSSYSVQLNSTGGPGSYVYSLGSGKLPSSLGLSQSGLISGTLTNAGTYNFTVNVISNGGGVTSTGSKSFSIGVPQITTSSPLPPGALNTAYSIQFQYSDGPASPFWGISAAPPGLSINASTGLLSGTPTATGTYTFSVRADQNSGSINSGPSTVTAIKNFSLTINSSATSGPTITTTSLMAGGVGQNYLQNVAATGGSPPYTFTASGLPDGLMISSGGSITGVPTTDGMYNVVVFVNDAKGSQGSRSFPLTILASLTIVTTSIIDGSVGHSYFQAIQAVGGTPPFTFTGSGFPNGITITPGGNISGTPSQAGTFPIEVDVTDAVKHFASAQYMLTIATLPVITTTSLPPGLPGVAYSQTITATGGLSPYSFFVLPTGTSNPLPPGITLAQSGLLAGTPTTPGAYSFTVQVVDSSQNSGTKTFQLTIGAASQSFVVSPLSLQFSGPSGGDVPGQQNIVISSIAAPVAFTAQVDDGNGGPAPTWLQATPGKGTTPGAVQVRILSNTLPAATYTARIRIGPGLITNVTVTYTVAAPAPKLSLTPSLLRFRAHLANPSTQQQTFILRNTGGGGPVPITLSVTGNSQWITSVTPSAQSVLQNAPVFVKVIVNSQGLTLGAHRDAIHVITPIGQFDVPITVTVLNQGPAISVLTSGVRVATIQGSQSSRSQQIFVRNVGDPGTVVNWTAQAIRGANFVTITNAQGVSTLTGPSSFTIQATVAASSSLGPKSALIKVSDPQSQDSPQFVVVVIDVAAAGSAPIPDPDPSGQLYITTSGGSSPASQQITVNTDSDNAVAFSVSTSTDDGATWLTATTASTTTSQASPAQVTVTVNPGALSANVYTGEVNIAIATVVRTVSITMIVKPAGTVAAFEGRAAAASCAPSTVAFVESGLVNSFSLPAGFPASLSAQVSDNCGNALTNAAVVASFSNGDPPLSLQGDQSGYYAATWQPGAATSEMTVTLDATSGSLNPAEMQLSGDVNTNANPGPSFVTGGLLNNLNPLVGAPLAPGTVTQVYGDNLAASPDSPSKVPLPTVFDGIETLIGGVNAPFFYVSKNQLVVQVPSELAANATYSALLVANGQYTIPQDVDFVPAVPGTVSFADGTIVAQHADFTLVNAAHPAKPNEPLTIYLVGMGATSQTVVSGNPAPSNPLANVSNAAQVTVDGQTAPISFAGLTPGGVGLYQINFTVPANAKTGSLPVVITQNGVTANATKLIVSQ